MNNERRLKRLWNYSKECRFLSGVLSVWSSDEKWSTPIWAEDRSLKGLFRITPDYSTMYFTSEAAQHLLRTQLHTARMTELSNDIVATSDGKFLTVRPAW